MQSQLYEQWLVGRVLDACATGTRTLADVVGRSEGADPLAVRMAADLATSQGKLPAEWQRKCGVSCSSSDDQPVESSLPVPHPLDYEWRFSKRGVRYVLDAVRELGGGELLLLGATTVAIGAARLGWANKIADVGQDLQVMGRRNAHPGVESIVADILRDVIPTQAARTVVADPPWYVPEIKSFLWMAAKHCVLGGHVLISLPGLGTRPGVTEERDDLRSFCDTIGLGLRGTDAQAVAYESPFFERNAFRAAGLKGDWRYWRRGDLWTLQRIGPMTAERPIPCELERWDACAIGRMGLRCRMDMDAPRRHSELGSIVSGDILPAVSRRDPRRARAAVWTSGNRIFACESPGTLVALGRAMAAGADISSGARAALGRDPTAEEVRRMGLLWEHLVELSRIEEREELGDSGAPGDVSV